MIPHPALKRWANLCRPLWDSIGQHEDLLMATNFLEQLAAEWYQYKEYLVWRNIPVRKSDLDIVAFKPRDKHLVHVETQMSTGDVEGTCKYKFANGRNHIPGMLSGLLCDGVTFQDLKFDQIALIDDVKERSVGGGRIENVSTFLKPILDEFGDLKKTKNVPEQFPILRALWYVAYYRTKKKLFV